MNNGKNVALLSLIAALLVRFLEQHYGIKISADDALDYIAAAFTAWHGFATAVAPFAIRIFNHYFPLTNDDGDSANVKPNH